MRKKNYLWYQFWRHTVVGNGLRFFYSTVKTSGKEHLPKDKPILYVPNHQNSFMDALHVATTTKPVIYFLTRAQAFKPDIIGKFLWSINMMPVYRVRDGLKSVQKNNEIFEKCIQYLKNKDTVLVFAEANHNLKRRIRPLSKGFTRIAFGAEEKHNWELDLQIVPVGVNYSEHRTGGNAVQVNYGKPIPVSNFRSLLEKDEKEAVETMKEQVSDAMKELVFHVEDLNEYPVHKILWDDLEPDNFKIIDPEIANPRIRKTHEHITPELIEKAKELTKIADKHDVDLNELACGKQVGVKDFVLFPFYLFSLLNNIIPYQPIRYLIRNVIRDNAFDSSIKFLSSLFLLPIFYVLVSLILLFTGVDGGFILGYLALSVLTAPLFIRAKQLFSPRSGRKLRKKKPALYDKLQSHLQSFKKLRESILNE
ncbi:MAG: 1-acyl-sn-glycerol-3-phosphate acyltransferase [Gracilimonas sp.]|uniref:1-acyl-sn-glycerol-3-phosphate acyltransferase n=1 Tax=Gracilimonas TaxID=649462 RepID=UPI001B146904|nr:1-acyl-sn-glycerol-3-phosphate acyltransferase [Gracilimonas sp.]MBO6584526.1 1-acyl-sn-glycerol-3-phosphate acyltransferase [Gracilimonas sp.]MBO6616203.1 1-acyl-sn-glycerol-3-phosphate acyltransferase [Gracilimonas sp.]